MCGIEARKKASSAIFILKEAVEYLQEYQNHIIDEIIFLLENNKDNVYVRKLKKEKSNFKESINDDFKWMKDYIIKPNQKKIQMSSSIYVIETLQLAYCDFYQEFNKYIDKIDRHEKVKKILKKLSNALSKKYKCN